MEKGLSYISYWDVGGLCDERDLHGTSLNLYISNNYLGDKYVTCVCKLRIGKMDISKEFDSKELPILKEVINKLEKFEFDKLTTDNSKLYIEDIGSDFIEYQYSDSDKRKIEYPNNSGLVKFINDLIYGCLVKDEKFNNTLKGIINSDSNFKYPVLNRIVDSDFVFDINSEYEFDKFNS